MVVIALSDRSSQRIGDISDRLDLGGAGRTLLVNAIIESAFPSFLPDLADSPLKKTSRFRVPFWVPAYVDSHRANRTRGNWFVARAIEYCFWANLPLTKDIEWNRKLVYVFGHKVVTTSSLLSERRSPPNVTISLCGKTGSLLMKSQPLLRSIGERELSSTSFSSVLTYLTIRHSTCNKAALPQEIQERAALLLSEAEADRLEIETETLKSRIS